MTYQKLTVVVVALATWLIYPLIFVNSVGAADSLSIYSDSLSSGWTSWSWGSWQNFANPSPVTTGAKSIAVGFSSWGGLYLHNDTAVNTSSFVTLNFSLWGSGQNQKFGIIAYDANNQPLKSALSLENYGGVANGSWKNYSIPLSDLGADKKDIKGLTIQEISGQSWPAVFVDDLKLIAPSITPTPITATGSTVYSDSLSSGWSNWSWNSTVDLNSKNPVYAGSQAVNFSPNSWGGLYFHTDSGLNTQDYQTLHFAALGSAGGQKLGVVVYDANSQPIKGSVSLDNYGGQPEIGKWKVYNIPLSDLGASNRQVKGMVIQEIGGQNQKNIAVDDLMFTTSSVNPTPLPTLTPIITPTGTPPAPSITPVPAIGGGYTVSAGKIYKDGRQVTLKGVSWFGFETGTHVVHGLWTRNWKDQILQMKNLGFNSVRIPFCPATLQGVTPDSIEYTKNSDLQGLNSLQILDKVVNEFNNQGMYVLLDHHTPDCNTITELWYTGSYSENQWVSDLKTVATRYSNLSYFLGIDIKNEPHGQSTWGTGNAATDWNLAAEKAGKQILSVNPNILIFVQGIQDNPTCSSAIGHWQGGNLEPQNCTPISTNAIPANKLAFSPHVYGPDVYNQSYFNDGSFPGNLTAIWETHFGNLVGKGFALVPGEWGGKYGNNGGNPKDVIWQDSFISYLKSKHICNSFYWDWNPNSGDTGGVLQDDWSTPWSNKVSLLNNYFSSCN